jgi:xylulokinase
MSPTRQTVTIGLDLGTSGCKGVVLDAHGQAQETTSVGYDTRRRLDGEVSQDPHDWLAAATKALRECSLLAAGRQVEAISVTAPAHVGVLLDTSDRPLARALLAWDSRPAVVLPELRKSLGESFFERTMVELATGWTFPQLVWLKGQLGNAWKQIRWLLTQKDYVRYVLTGEVAVDPTDAQGTGLYDPRAGGWGWDLVRESGLERCQLPPVMPSSASGGTLSRTWARRTGLRAGTPVIVGATDTAMELVSLGATRAGASLIKVASTGTVVVVSRKPMPDRRLLTYPHAAEGLWYQLGATNTAATSYVWLRETVFARDSGTPAEVYAEMDQVAAGLPAGSGGLLFLPFLEGERTPYWDPGLRGAFIGLSSAHRRAHMCRAVLEGVALSLRACRDVFAEHQAMIARPSLGGGGSNSRLWRAILVSVFGHSARWPRPQGPALGAAMLAARSVGLTGRVDRRTTMVHPRQEWIDTYEQVYAAYTEAVERVGALTNRLASIT